MIDAIIITLTVIYCVLGVLALGWLFWVAYDAGYKADVEISKCRQLRKEMENRRRKL